MIPSILEVLSKSGIDYPADKTKFKIRCPLGTHEDKNPSFNVNVGEKPGVFFCFGCQKGGGAIGLIALLGQDVSSYDLRGRSREDDKYNPLELVDLEWRLARANERKDVLDYLRDRKIPEDRIPAWGCLRHAHGLVGGHSKSAPLVVPLCSCDEHGVAQLVGIHGRALTPTEDKNRKCNRWVATDADEPRIIALPGLRLKECTRLIIVEGILDFISAHHVRFGGEGTMVVGVPGADTAERAASNIAPHLGQCTEILCFVDRDKSGERTVSPFAELGSRLGIPCRRAVFRAGEDLADELGRLLSEGEDPSEHSFKYEIVEWQPPVAGATTEATTDERVSSGSVLERSKALPVDFAATRLVGVVAACSLALEELRKRHENPLKPVSTGIPSLDLVLGGGLPFAAMILLASCPGVGKTSLALFIALCHAAAGNPVLILSLELTVEDLVSRMFVLNHGSATWSDVANGGHYEEVAAYIEQLASYPLEIVCDVGSWEEVEQLVLGMLDKYQRPPLVVLDHAQILSSLVCPGVEQRQANDTVADKILKLTKTTRSCFLVISSVGRAAYSLVDDRGRVLWDKALAASKESGRWESHATVLLALSPVFTDEDSQRASTSERRTWILLAKYRRGADHLRFPAMYVGRSGAFYEISPDKMPGAGDGAPPDLDSLIIDVCRENYLSSAGAVAKLLHLPRGVVSGRVKALVASRILQRHRGRFVVGEGRDGH